MKVNKQKLVVRISGKKVVFQIVAVFFSPLRTGDR
jgi:ribosomal protein L18